MLLIAQNDEQRPDGQSAPNRVAEKCILYRTWHLYGCTSSGVQCTYSVQQSNNSVSVNRWCRDHRNVKREAKPLVVQLDFTPLRITSQRQLAESYPQNMAHVGSNLPAKKRHVKSAMFDEDSSGDVQIISPPKGSAARAEGVTKENSVVKATSDDYSTSSASFQSPGPDDQFDSDLDAVDEDPTETATYVPHDSQDDSLAGLAFDPGFGTQPPTKIKRTPTKINTKKRKVSLSPAAQPMSRSEATSPRVATKPSAPVVTTSKKRKTLDTPASSPPANIPKRRCSPRSNKTEPKCDSCPDGSDSTKKPPVVTKTPGKRATNVMDVEEAPIYPKNKATGKSGPSEGKDTNVAMQSGKPDHKKTDQNSGSISSSGSAKAEDMKSKKKRKQTKKSDTPASDNDTIRLDKKNKKKNLRDQSLTTETAREKSLNPSQKDSIEKDKKSKTLDTKDNAASKVASKSGKSKSSTQKLSDGKLAEKDSKKSAGQIKIGQKKKKRTFQDELLHHMFMSCKPFTVKMLAEQMKSSDASINFCLLSLVDKKWVIKKEFSSKGGNRTKELYWANQTCTAKELLDSLQLVPLDVIREARQDFAGVRKQELALAKELESVLQQPSNEALTAQIIASENVVQDLRRGLEETHGRINAVRGKGQKTMCQKSVKKRINEMRGEWVKRKNKCVDFLENLADGLDRKVKDVVKLIEIETDESVGAKIPPKYTIE